MPAKHGFCLLKRVDVSLWLGDVEGEDKELGVWVVRFEFVKDRRVAKRRDDTIAVLQSEFCHTTTEARRSACDYEKKKTCDPGVRSAITLKDYGNRERTEPDSWS